jgi:hypothetical protein
VPGEIAIKIHSPAVNGKPELLIESNTQKMLFIGSAFKSQNEYDLDGCFWRQDVAL